ncbi:minor head protein [Pseudomonas phage vB_PaeP_PAO1_Ab05]|uniref:Uncharacterized protein n=1 Tax=Pseudomonas phage vB_PaeP_PAO1_Ab05 TaxID=1548902 RepID=A0A0A1IW93_9CAUD|nr:minor head protein [Pseudomonas phage vB_PaeP_PAO1_Ab05]CEF89314.1 hypothetical protein [Pseudomonas phage vB_PaeP_PAO1_Ab05]
MANTRDQYLAGRNTGLTFYQVCQPGTDNRIALHDMDEADVKAKATAVIAAAAALGGEGGTATPDPTTAYKTKTGAKVKVQGVDATLTVANGAVSAATLPATAYVAQSGVEITGADGNKVTLTIAGGAVTAIAYTPKP